MLLDANLNRWCKVKKFKQNPHGTNEILNGDDFYISYQANPSPLGISIFRSDNSSVETAIVDKNDPENQYRILNGDFRKDYVKLVPKGLKACVKFYDKMKADHKSSWSTNQE